MKLLKEFHGVVVVWNIESWLFNQKNKKLRKCRWKLFKEELEVTTCLCFSAIRWSLHKRPDIVIYIFSKYRLKIAFNTRNIMLTYRCSFLTKYKTCKSNFLGFYLAWRYLDAIAEMNVYLVWRHFAAISSVTLSKVFDIYTSSVKYFYGLNIWLNLQ